MCFNLFSKTNQGSYKPDTKPATESDTESVTESAYGLKKSPDTHIQSEVHSYSESINGFFTNYRDRRSNIITGNFSKLPKLAKMWQKLIDEDFTYRKYDYRTRTDKPNSGDGSEKSLVRLIDIGDDPVINSFPIKLVKFIREFIAALKSDGFISLETLRSYETYIFQFYLVCPELLKLPTKGYKRYITKFPFRMWSKQIYLMINDIAKYVFKYLKDFNVFVVYSTEVEDMSKFDRSCYEEAGVPLPTSHS
jgi:hypothetical protein